MLTEISFGVPGFEYDEKCKLLQITQYGEEVIGTAEPVNREAWEEFICWAEKDAGE